MTRALHLPRPLFIPRGVGATTAATPATGASDRRRRSSCHGGSRYTGRPRRHASNGATFLARGTVLLAVPALLALGACTGSADTTHLPGSKTCAPAGAMEVAAAITQYVQTVVPPPERFVIEAVGDSALPEGGQQALQDKGPTFLFPNDPAKQKAELAQLATRGEFATLLVLYGGTRQLSDKEAVVHLSSRYVMGVKVPATTPSSALHFTCKDGAWQFTQPTGVKTS